MCVHVCEETGRLYNFFYEIVTVESGQRRRFGIYLLGDVPQRRPGCPSWLWWWRHLISLTQWPSLLPPAEVKTHRGAVIQARTPNRMLRRQPLTFSPSKAPASLGMVALLLLRVIRPIRWSPSLDGCQVTGCCRMETAHLRRQSLIIINIWQHKSSGTCKII